MQISCKICGSRFVSVILDQEKATQELTQKAIDHIEKHHHNQRIQLIQQHQTLINASVWLMLMKNFISYQEEKFLMDEVDKWDMELAKLLGLNIPHELVSTGIKN